MKKSLTIDETTAKQIYKNADSSLKTILEETFTKQFFSEKLIDRIKTYSDVCKELGVKELTIKDFNFLPVNQRDRALANHQIENISELFNEGWKPNFSNYNEYKYYPYFERKSSGWVFSDCYCRSYLSDVSSAFYFKSSEIATYCGKQFIDIYSKILE